MDRSIRLTLPNPCAEDWDKMMPDSRGRFCASCEKTVVDFTTFSDEAFIEYFRKNGVNTCGRFSPHQFDLEIPWLNTNNTKSPINNPLQRALKYAVLSLIPLATPAVRLFAQEPQQEAQKVTPLSMQPRIANGIVLDENGQGIPGTSVQVQGTKTGTITDLDGRFSITLPEGYDTLAFNAFGKVPQVIKAGSSDQVVTIKLCKDPAAVDGPLTIMGITRQKNPDDSSKMIIKRPITDITKALEGAAPGLQTVFSNVGIPSPSPSALIIRGNHTSGAPLIVLNGKPFRGNITDIDPKEVKTLNILKGPEATALYGAAGINGVIIIKTKHTSFWYRLTKPFGKSDK